jgi:hypothetical protein
MLCLHAIHSRSFERAPQGHAMRVCEARWDEVWCGGFLGMRPLGAQWPICLLVARLSCIGCFHLGMVDVPVGQLYALCAACVLLCVSDSCAPCLAFQRNACMCAAGLPHMHIEGGLSHMHIFTAQT